MKRTLRYEQSHFRIELSALIAFVLFCKGEIPAISQPHKVTSPDKRIRAAYAEGDRLIGIAWGWSMTDGEPLRPGYEPATPQPVGTGKSVASSGEPGKKTYPYSANYKYSNDQVWKKDVREVEQKFRELIAEYLSREGSGSRTVACLRDHLSTLYSYSKNGDSKVLDEQVRKVLWPSCPKCHRSDRVSMLSPKPNEHIEGQLKHGWWFCRRCSKEFLATRSEAR